MDSNKIKALAFGARDALCAEVGARIKAVLAEDSAERLDEPEKVRALEASIADRGLDAVVESTAYTWFNRLCALRFMDARSYTPVPAVTPRAGATQPAVLADAAGKYVYVVGKNGERVRRDVKLRVPVGAIDAQVLEGLEEGERIYVTDK